MKILFSVLPHLNYHDVDYTFMAGMLSVLPADVAGDVTLELRDKLKYPKQIHCGKEYDALPAMAKKFRLRSGAEFDKVERELQQFVREGIDTHADHNSAIRAVLIQLKYPKPVKSHVVRHQIAAHMVEDYEFYYPKMEAYLEHHNLSYSAYIMHLYRGDIWADEFMLGALSRMFDITISVISPLYNDVWQIFHNSGLPHVVIISNGGDIGKKRGASHFSATRGKGPKWSCIGENLNVGEMGSWQGYKEGREHVIDAFQMKEHFNIMKTTRKMAEKIQGLCKDLNKLCDRRDEIYKEMEAMRIKVDEFKRFDTFYYEIVDESEKQPVLKKVGKHKKKNEGETAKRTEPEVHKSAKKQMSARSCSTFPKQLGSKLVSDAISEIDKGLEIGNLPTEDTIKDIVSSQKRRCRVKNPKEPRFPSLPKYDDGSHPDETTSAIQTTEKQMKQWTVQVEPETPYNLSATKKVKDDEPGVVSVRAISPEAELSTDVITKQPEASGNDILSGKRASGTEISSEPKRQRTDDELVMYGQIPMSRNVVRFLRQQQQENELPEVHTSSKATNEITTSADAAEDDSVLKKPQEKKVYYVEKETIEITDPKELSVLEGAIYDEDDNIVGVKGRPNFRFFIPREGISEAQDRRKLLPKEVAIDVTPNEPETEPQEVTVATTKKGDPKRKVQKPSTQKVVQLVPPQTPLQKILVTIPQNKDTSNEDPPIPKTKRKDHLHYCDRCCFVTKDKAYLRRHNKRQCVFLT